VRVLLVTNHYPPVLGMSSRGMAELSKALVRQGHAADVLTTVPTPGHPVYKFNFAEMQHVPTQVNVHRVPMGPFNRTTARFLARFNRSGASGDGAGANHNGKHHVISAAVRLAARLYQARKAVQPFLVPDANVDWIPAAVLEARRMLNSASYDVVASFGYPHTAHCVAYLALRGRNIPWVVIHAEGWGTSPGMEELPRWSRNLHRLLESKFSQRAARIVVCSCAAGLMRKLPDAYGIDPQKLHLAQFSFVDPAPYESVETVATEHLHMVYTGTFYPETRQDPGELFEAIKIVGSSEIRLSILGDGNGRFEDWVKEREIPNVEFLGWCSHDTAVQYQKRAKLLVVFGHSGGQQVPTKVYEYFMARSPILCIAADQSDLTARLVRQHARGIVVSNSRDQIAAALGECLAMHKDGGIDKQFNLGELPQYAPQYSGEELMRAVLGERNEVSLRDISTLSLKAAGTAA
jgi:glycosyltransferase involved in cell wall biosynthesis